MDISELDDMIASSNVGKSTATNTISGTHEVILNRRHVKKLLTDSDDNLDDNAN